MKTRNANGCRLHVRTLAASIACLAVVGCGDRGAAPDPYQTDGILAAVPCEAWRPSDADWSSPPTSRPSIIRTPSASANGEYLYSVGTWFGAGNVRRQILRSRDLGETWCVLPTPDPVSQVAPSRASDTVLYAVTCAQGGTAAHTIKTIDGGATWTTTAAQLPDGVDNCAGASSVLETSVTDPGALWINPSNSINIYQGTLYFSGDGAESWASVLDPPALVRPADVPLDFLNLPEGGVEGMLVDPRSSSSVRQVLAWGSIGTLGAGMGPERWFTSDDAGNSWREITAPALPADMSRYPIVVADVASSLYVSGGPVVFRSSNWGETWDLATRLPDPQARLATLASRNPGQLFAWDVDAGDRWADTTVWTSLDRGSTWRALAVPLHPAIDPVLAPQGADVIVGLGGLGISVTQNGGSSWTPRPIVAAPGSLAQSPVDGRRIWADDRTSQTSWSLRGTSFPGLQSTDGGMTWTTVGDLSGPVLMDGASADAAFQGVYYGSAGPQRTEDGGHTWASFSVPNGAIVSAATCPAPASCLYVLLSDWTAGVPCRLVRSDDRGRTWAGDQPVPAELCYGDKLAVSPGGRERLVASCVTTVCVTGDGGQSWTSRSIGDGPERSISSILFMSDGVVLAATSTDGPLGETKSSVVARSTDGGSTWTDVLTEVGTLFASVAQPETAFLVAGRSMQGTRAYDVVFRSDDSGATWRLASPEGALDEGFNINSIVDAPGGGFVASTIHGLVHFK